MKKLKHLQQKIAQGISVEGEVLHFLQMLHIVLDTIPQRIFWKDTNSIYLGCNNMFAQDAGLASADDVIGKTDFDFPWSDSAEEYRSYDQEVMQTLTPRLAYEQIMHNATGEMITVRIHKIPLVDKGGKVIGVLGSYEDITSHKKMEMELLVSEERRRSEAQIRKLSIALEQSPVSVLITDSNGRIEYVNAKFAQLSGYHPLELIGKTPSLLKSGYHDPVYYKDMWSTLQRGEEWKGTFCNKKKNGEIYWESAVISPLKDEQNKVTHFVAVKEDITDKLRAEEALKESYDHLKKLEKLRDNLTHMIVHDMRTPLTCVSMAFSLLKTSIPAEDMTALGTIELGEKSATDLIDMAKDLLDVSRMEEGKMPLARQEINLTALSQSIVNTFPATVSKRQVSLSSPTTVEACFDPDIIQRVITNLIANAIKFTLQDGIIKVAVFDLGDNVKITVADNGLGIPPEVVGRIFEKFGQAETKNKKYGVGLGLTFCKLAVEAHGGTIGVESELKRGSIFWFTLPKFSEPLPSNHSD